MGCNRGIEASGDYMRLVRNLLVFIIMVIIMVINMNVDGAGIGGLGRRVNGWCAHHFTVKNSALWGAINLVTPR
jgi:hypothetical protein